MKGTAMRSIQPASVVTGMRFLAPIERSWDGLLLYEQTPRRPPLLLRLLLPVPLGTAGAGSRVGDQMLCMYETGHLIKRTTRVDWGRHYEFAVVEQRLSVGAGLRLVDGGYTFRELPDGTTHVALETRYLSRRRPGWLWRRIESAVCHAFHRHILAAMRQDVESRRPIGEATQRRRIAARDLRCHAASRSLKRTRRRERSAR